MNSRKSPVQKALGDFQTPLALAEAVCTRIAGLGVRPATIIEPTCGRGAFVEASAKIFPEVGRIVGLDISAEYLQEARARIDQSDCRLQIELRQGNFFTFDWDGLATGVAPDVLVIGNLPWVTNSEQEKTGSDNLPQKSNFLNHKGLDALTGKSNFDISEWMLLKLAEAFGNSPWHLAMLCKTTTARKFLAQMRKSKSALLSATLWSISAKAYFGASVEACLLYCKFGPGHPQYDYHIYESLDGSAFTTIGHRFALSIRDTTTFDALADLYSHNGGRWRSGIKHDCADVLELVEQDSQLVNGLGEPVVIEPEYLFPLLKGSDVANGRTSATRRRLLVTQRQVGASTAAIASNAPQTWRYLVTNAEAFAKRKSRIYHGREQFAIFGVGSYTFAPWKVAISGLYKSLDFRLVEPIDGKPVVFDDTVNFLSFGERGEAQTAYDLLVSRPATEFLQSLIFWDEKRPVKASILNCLDLDALRSLLFGTKPLQPSLLGDPAYDRTIE